jgi:hypothetical protein
MLWTPGNPPLTVPGEGEADGRARPPCLQAPLARLIAEEADRRRASDDPGGDVIGSLVPRRSFADRPGVADELTVVLAGALGSCGACGCARSGTGRSAWSCAEPCSCPIEPR